MKVDHSRLVVGDEWAYRQRDEAVSERVRILAVEPKTNSVRVEITFLDEPDRRTEKVPGSRLRVPWSEVDAFNTRMANWERVDNLELDDVESSCVEEIFQLLIEQEIAELLWSPVSCATSIQDRSQLSDLIGAPIDDILASVPWFELEGRIIVSPAGTLLLVEAACRAHSVRVLDVVLEQEAECRHKCKFGSDRPRFRGDDTSTTPEYEYNWYRRYDRPRHELLRQWCGHRAVTHYERFLAAEAEVHRLDVLVTDLVKTLDGLGEHDAAARFADEHEQDRITPHTIRPIVDRPLHPSEIPVREVRVRRRWW